MYCCFADRSDMRSRIAAKRGSAMLSMMPEITSTTTISAMETPRRARRRGGDSAGTWWKGRADARLGVSNKCAHVGSLGIRRRSFAAARN